MNAYELSIDVPENHRSCKNGDMPLPHDGLATGISTVQAPKPLFGLPDFRRDMAIVTLPDYGSLAKPRELRSDVR